MAYQPGLQARVDNLSGCIRIYTLHDVGLKHNLSDDTGGAPASPPFTSMVVDNHETPDNITKTSRQELILWQ